METETTPATPARQTKRQAEIAAFIEVCRENGREDAAYYLRTGSVLYHAPTVDALPLPSKLRLHVEAYKDGFREIAGKPFDVARRGR